MSIFSKKCLIWGGGFLSMHIQSLEDSIIVKEDLVKKWTIHITKSTISDLNKATKYMEDTENWKRGQGKYIKILTQNY